MLSLKLPSISVYEWDWDYSLSVDHEPLEPNSQCIITLPLLLTHGLAQEFPLASRDSYPSQLLTPQTGPSLSDGIKSARIGDKAPDTGDNAAEEMSMYDECPKEESDEAIQIEILMMPYVGICKKNDRSNVMDGVSGVSLSVGSFIDVYGNGEDILWYWWYYGLMMDPKMDQDSESDAGSCDTNLYTISLDDTLRSSPICLLFKASKAKSWLWHRRLSHLNFCTLNKLAKDGLARGIPRLKFQKDHLCSTCALGKSKKSSHQPKAEDTNQEKLYLCALICVADAFLKTKDEAPAAIIKCIKDIQVRLKAIVQNVRTDNGTEFVNQTLREWSLGFLLAFAPAKKRAESTTEGPS
ncbi:retrovirus-related pol polyprotein from transposon TNT 1-94 [Tanacetum coccineum]|uniref:Retrovirus-related pol polyprotein from transposon TNT 1-94 n=1 Tax=Tanacetum coccineum TaxID=301880 RepID=A0ABQ4ZQ61_9ASTR